MKITKERLSLYMDYVRYQNHLSQRFSDCFYSSQLDSKSWLIEKLRLYSDGKKFNNVHVFGGWYGVLATLLKDNFQILGNITTVDVDPDCEEVVRRITTKEDKINAVTCDMMKYVYNDTPELVINTSCEHISQMAYYNWWDNVPIGTWFVLQSNNLEIGEHIRTASSLQEFEGQCGHENILYSGELDCGNFSRYMIIGIKDGYEIRV